MIPTTPAQGSPARFDAIPAELRQRDQWVVWRSEDRDGKPTKVPLTAAGRPATSTDMATWTGFDQVVAVAARFDGIGYVFSAEDPYCGVHLDDCLEDRHLHPAAASLVLRLNSFCEVSPSGTGVKLIVRASKNGTTRCRTRASWGGDVEIYDHARFWTITGTTLIGTRTTIEDRQAELDALLAEFLPTVPDTGDANLGPRQPVDLDDHELLETMFASKSGQTIRALWAGAISGYLSQSEADQALCNYLAFWTNRDAARMDSLFRSSGLMRLKWERQDYRERTIETAIAATPEGYRPRVNSRSPSPTVVTVGRFRGAPGSSGVTNSRTVTPVREDGTTTTPTTGRVEGGPEQSEPPVTVAATATDSEAVEDTFVDPTVTLSKFVALVDESASEPLMTCDQGSALLRGSLGLLVAKTGDGKTTLMVAYVLHAAAGLDFAGFRFPRPLRLLVIQNEGPREAFRQKLEAAADLWEHPLEAVRVWDEPESWGSVKVSVPEARSRLRHVLELHDVDIVIVDTLTRYGVRGNGTPEETREFIEWLTETGLGRDRGFLLLHHPITRPDASLDLIERIAGAWAPHADVVLYLEKLADKRARLSSARLRWAREDRPAVLFGFDPETSAFTYLGEQSGEERDYLADVKALLRDGTWRIVREISQPKEDGGIGADYDLVKELLEEHPDEFESRTGEAAKLLGRKPQATLWQLRNDEDEAVA